MELYSVLVTGANRGIGLEFVRQLALLTPSPTHIFATYRNIDTIQKLEEIQKSAPSLVQVHLVKLDVQKSEDLDHLKRIVDDIVGKKGLTLLINNAGVLTGLPFPNVTAQNLDFHFQVNTVGPILVTQAFLPLLKRAASLNARPSMSFSKAAVLNISSSSGSIADTYLGCELDDIDCPSYKISKTALNMAMRVMSVTVKEDSVLIVNICPGYVSTDMGTGEADISPTESVSTMLSTISSLNENHHGTFMNRFGNPHLW